MENYFKRDIDRIKEKFHKSRIFKMNGKYSDHPLFKGIHYSVSRQCMKLLIIEVELIDKWETKADEVCVCNMKKYMGLPCRHMIINYEHGVIPLSDIDSFWKHLSFIPPPKEEEAEEEFGDNEMGRTVLEMYRGMNKLQKQMSWDDMRKIIYPQTQENVYEPAKGKPKGKPSKKETKKQLREYAEVLRKKKSEKNANTRDPCGHEYTAAMYLEKTKKWGRSIEEKGETSERDLKKKGPVCPSQPSQPSSGDAKLKSPMCPIQPYFLDVKLEAQNKDYLNELPLYIREYVISTNDIPLDGNCGFHDVNQRLGTFIEGAKRNNGCAITHIRQRLLSKLKKNPSFYKTMLCDGEGTLNEQFIRYQLLLHGAHPMTSDYWMIMPICGHLIAEGLNCVVHYFSKHASFTFTPKTIVCVEQLKQRRCVMALINNNHFIGLRLNPDCPLPPICGTSYWPAFNPDRMLGWCIMYESNMEMWRALKKSEEIVHEGQISLEDD
ncbi:uncharacterized protein LOC113336776 [Papaver somniferum]|uniref:uncharacterized protein LOC113336776 n=1 Tax=Papaver somniferum TaxID=3469 RepID=UPI000E6FD7A9|nr:uncharacterized protein LOC113336776 [Papaver somniferum]